MSLFNLMWHFMTTQTSANLPKDSHGGVNRYAPWHFQDQNIRCNIQGMDKKDVIEKFGIKERENIFTIFYIDDLITIDHTLRIITKKDYRNSINDTADVTEANRDQFRVFEYMGGREPVRKRTGQLLFEIYVEENSRWQL